MTRTFVLKLSGKALDDAQAARPLYRAVAAARASGARIVVVHGGGRQLDLLAARLGHEATVVAGRRVTDDDTLALAKLAFSGNGVDVASGLTAAGVPALPIPAGSAGIVTTVRRPAVTVTDDDGAVKTVDFGHVGDVVAVDPAPLTALLGAGFVPVLSPLGMDPTGAVHNVNADTIAAAVAAALHADELLLVSDVEGILADPSDPASVLARLTTTEARKLLAAGKAKGGMRPKLAAVETALARGVPRARICAAAAAAYGLEPLSRGLMIPLGTCIEPATA